MAPAQIKVVYDYYSAKRTTPFFITEEELLNLDFHSFIMRGSILPVATPPGKPRGQVQPFGPGGGELFEPSCPGGRGVGQIEYNFLLFF